MLVILNTVEAVMKRYIAGSLYNALNSLDSYQVGEYYVDYTDAPFRIKNSEGEVVYRAGDYRGKGGVSTLLQIDPNAVSIIEQASAYQSHLDELNVKYHLTTTFSDPVHELLNTDAPEYKADVDALLGMYAEKEHDYLVVSGNFSRTFVLQVITRLGSDVKIINVTRNPSVAYMMDASYLRTKIPFENVDTFGNRLFGSLLDCAQLRTVLNVINVKFEDILKDGGFTFEGKFVDLSDYGNFNNIITMHEKVTTLMEEHNIPKRDQLASVNSVLSNRESVYPDHTHFPNNMFEALGYAGPLTLSEMITPLADDANSQP